MIIPAINTKGNFTFAPPFDYYTNTTQEYTVTAIRTLLEMHNSEEKPFDTIYKPAGLTEEDFKNDVDGNIPIIVFSTSGCEYFYIPANRITTVPVVTGVKYKERILAISLGSLPVDYNLDMIKQMLLDLVYDITGIKASITELPSSATFLVSQEDHELFMLRLANKKNIDKSFRTKLLETEETNKQLRQRVGVLEECLKKNCLSNT